MGFDKIKEIIERIPFGILFVLFLGYLGVTYYFFRFNSDSVLNLKKEEVDRAQKKKAALQVKNKALNEFIKNLEQKKVEVRALASELKNMQGALPESVNIPDFMKVLVTEAKRVGITVVSLNPLPLVKADFYAEIPFSFKFSGAYLQVLNFFEHLSNISQIVRMDTFQVQVEETQKTKYITLGGEFILKTYKYIGSAADSAGNSDKTSEADSTKKPADQGGAK